MTDPTPDPNQQPEKPPIEVRTDTVTLTAEQEFSLRSFELQVRQMSREQAQKFLIDLRRQMMIREVMYQHLLKHDWGIHGGPKP